MAGLRDLKDCAWLNLVTCRGEDYTRPGRCLGDVPHLFYHLISTYWPDKRLKCNSPDMCESREYLDYWRTTYQSVADQPNLGNRLEHLLFCPNPHSYSKGPHRMMFDIWYSGERFVLAVEEAFPCTRPTQNVFIGAFSAVGKAHLLASKDCVIDIIAAAMHMAPKDLRRVQYSEKEKSDEDLQCVTTPREGYILDPKAHTFKINIVDKAEYLAVEECNPSPSINNY